MLRKGLGIASIAILLGAVCLSNLWQTQSSQEKARQRAVGIVYHDKNNNRTFDKGDAGIADVRVSNGKDIVKTDKDGKYEIMVDDDTILFVIQPSGWRTPVSESMLPQFYYIHKPNGSIKLKYKGVEPTGPLPSSVNFALYPQKQPETFKAILFGDPQPSNQQEVDYIAHDVLEELIGTDASFGVTLGDIMNNDLSLFEAEAKAVALLGIPWYNVIGNHDINFDARRRGDANETFERNFGPSYYSFDYGAVHFLVLDDIDWRVMNEKTGQWGYRGGLGDTQMEFIRNDLAMIPENQMVVLLMHIPLTGVHDRQELYRLIEKRPFCMSISGHQHYHEHVFIDKADGWQGAKPHHHVINVTVSGSWWGGAPDERGIPHTTMRDGAPNGYSIITFDGNKYTLDFKAAGRPADYQMNIQAPEAVASNLAGKADVYVNVFNGSPRSKVEMRLGNRTPWLTMKQRLAQDPAYVKIYKTEAALKDKSWKKLPGAMKSPHLWHSNLPEDLEPGIYNLQVRTTDMHGRTYNANRLIRILPASKIPAKEDAPKEDSKPK